MERFLVYLCIGVKLLILDTLSTYTYEIDLKNLHLNTPFLLVLNNSIFAPPPRRAKRAIQFFFAQDAFCASYLTVLRCAKKCVLREKKCFLGAPLLFCLELKWPAIWRFHTPHATVSGLKKVPPPRICTVPGYRYGTFVYRYS